MNYEEFKKRFWEKIDKEIPDDPELQESYASFLSGQFIENDDSSAQLFVKWLYERVNAGYENGATLNIGRFREVQFAKETLEQIANDEGMENWVVEVNPDPILFGGYIVELQAQDAMCFRPWSYERLFSVLKLADNFEISFYPEAGESSEQMYTLALTFTDVFILPKAEH